jgi:GNAT superfamily N-acetyltransferase
MSHDLQTLGSADVADALALSTREGWNQSATDWERMFALEPAGCFGLREGGRLIGTVTTTTYGRELAWIGMMIVDPAFRRRGIGEALMRRALDHLDGLGVPTVKLDATPAGKPLYERLGFTAELEMERWTGVARPPAASPPPDREETWSRLCALDRDAYGIDRSRLLRVLVRDSVGEPCVRESGYSLARRVRDAAFVGPVIARDEPVALALLDAMLARLGGETIGLDRHTGGFLTPRALEARGLGFRRGLTRMFRGERTSAATSPAISGGSGPQFG